ncbi:hypothetical protein EDD90_2726 [Streptomyces sp. Ag109_O5-1]|uniref:DUF6415 family natural product biosynthesis protein n=1 Tax=Streptomyces sp. Ag109_O5-1 TaxID=1938851 RepID=UPI000F4D7058|nr:DUF6415 family natural product biosynthesis protein [Streptomyces sp. Ag109_O5-1]RPE39709.1 hypothetical protein EDD90_2726 [Streptomyces sp. Ag109_O5-1]
MTTSAPPRWNLPAETCSPPLGPADLDDFLKRLRDWEPFDSGVVLDDVGDALDDVAPDAVALDALARRLRRHLERLVAIAVANEAEERDEATAGLVGRARPLAAEALPDDQARALVQLRQMGWTTHELLERLIETKCLREAV